MWIFTKDHGYYNLDKYDKLDFDSYHTVLIQYGKPGCVVSRSDVREKIADAIRNGDNYVEVD